jgi:hypothetical protein
MAQSPREKIRRKNRNTFSASRKIDAASSGAETRPPHGEVHADQAGEGDDEPGDGPGRQRPGGQRAAARAELAR